MIELMLQAERALMVGLVDQAERLYQMAARNDPRNAIAVVGLARVALERSDDRGAYDLSRQALTIDPENAAALRLEARLSEVLTHRGETVERPEFVIAGDETAASSVRDRPNASPEPFPPTPRVDRNGSAAGIGVAVGPPIGSPGPGSSSGRRSERPWTPPGWGTRDEEAAASAAPPAETPRPAEAPPPANAPPPAEGPPPRAAAAPSEAPEEPKPFRIWPPPGRKPTVPRPTVSPTAIGRPDVDLNDPSTWPARPADPTLNARMSAEAASAATPTPDGDVADERVLRGGVPESAAVAAPWAASDGATAAPSEAPPAHIESPRRVGFLRRLFGR